MQKQITRNEDPFAQENQQNRPNSSSIYSFFKNPLENLFENTGSNLLAGVNKKVDNDVSGSSERMDYVDDESMELGLGLGKVNVVNRFQTMKKEGNIYKDKVSGVDFQRRVKPLIPRIP